MIKHLKRELKNTEILDKEEDFAAYSCDASQIEGHPRAIFLPTDLDDIRKLIRYCNHHDIIIVPRGGGTGLAGGCYPDDAFVLDLSRLNKIIEINEEKNYCIVETGIILDNLNEELKKKSLLFPIKPSSHQHCTIGGMIATNASGNRAIKYGSVKDWIEELYIFDASGKIFKVKGKDINDFAAKEGTTGIIVNAKIKLTKEIQKTSLSYFKFNNNKELINKIIEAKENSNVIAIEYINKATAEQMNEDPQHLLFIEYEDDSGEIKDPKTIQETWKKREGVFTVLASKGYGVIEDPKLDFTNIRKFLDWIDEKNIPCFGHIGEGIIHPLFKEEQKELIKDMFEKLINLNAIISGEHGYGITKKDYVSDRIKTKIKKLKKIYDKNNILNKGKII